jgi:hypothetical protein
VRPGLFSPPDVQHIHRTQGFSLTYPSQVHSEGFGSLARPQWAGPVVKLYSGRSEVSSTSNGRLQRGKGPGAALTTLSAENIACTDFHTKILVTPPAEEPADTFLHKVWTNPATISPESAPCKQTSCLRYRAVLSRIANSDHRVGDSPL